jgi:lambda family phage tail tape measure protein
LRSVEQAEQQINDIYARARVERAELQAKYDKIFLDKVEQGLDMEAELIMQSSDKNFKRELDKFDKQMEIRDRRRRRPLTGMQLAQGVGAALSGGIFGGPEGLIGGLGGLALGGVGGAFAGAAAGAQVGMFRQQLGGVTDYSARIDKLQIALRGIVGSQDAYNRALAAADSVTRDLNIPQEVAIQGMTRLSAAVKGAGGTVSDSAFAFRAVSEAVKATGGNAEQADGALLALTQVFSKGKVSAEELNQIAERLPGTFTLFAKAAGMTGPQLQKALQEGQVGLNDLMKFLQLISTEYGQTALKIAASSQEAGARLSVAMQDMQLAVGRALQPVGALLQDAFAAFIRSTTPALVLSAKLIGGGITNMYNAFASGINILVSLRGVFENLAKTMLVFGGITAGVFVASNITTFTNALKGALAVLRTLLSVEKALLVIENARIAAQAILAGLTTGATKGKILGAILGGAAGVGAVIGIGKLVEGVIGDIEKGLSGALKGLDLKLPTLSKFPTPSAGSDKAAKDAEKERKKAAEEALRQQTSLNRLLQEQLRLNYEAGAVDADALSKLDAEATLLKLITRLKIDEVTLSAKTRQEREQGIINLTAEFTAENKRIKKQRREILEEIAGLGDEIKKEWRELTGVFIDESPIDAGIRKFEEARIDFIERRDKEMKQLREKAGLRPEGAAKLGQISGAKAAAEAITPGQIRAVVSKQILQDDIAALQADIRALESGANTMGTLGEIMERHRKYWQDLDEGQRQYIANLAEIKDSLRFMQDARIGVGLKEGAQAYVQSIGTMREATAQLAQTGIKGVEDAIFSLVTTGTANFQEFAASILRDTARMIIQQLILRSVMQIIGAIGGGGGSAISPLSNFNAGVAQYAPLANAMGNAYAANGIVPFAMGGTFQRNVTAYAMGGIVNKPTLFKFANGGAGRLGLMGEAGPEAIMPLRRLPSGRLGVESAGSGGNSVQVDNITINVENSGEQLSPAAQKQIAGQVRGIVLATLVDQRRGGGVLR